MDFELDVDTLVEMIVKLLGPVADQTRGADDEGGWEGQDVAA